MTKKSSPAKSSLQSLRLILPLVALTLVGIVFQLNATSSNSYQLFNNQFGYVSRQVIWLLFSSVAFFISAKINWKVYSKLSLYFYIGAIFLLVLVLIPGMSQTIFGARRWLKFGFFTLQPSEVFKLAAIIFFSKIFSQEGSLKPSIFLWILIPLILIIAQPNLSTTILICTILSFMYYLANKPLLPLLSLGAIGFISAIVLTLTTPYRLERLKNIGTSYHQQQLEISFMQGGIFGRGMGNSIQKYQYLPQVATDSIFAVIAEETGLMGTLFIIILYLYLVSTILFYAKTITAPDQKIFLVGAGSLIFIQSFIHMAASVSIIPLTGLPLPFVSYGGSSLLFTFILMGICFNIIKQHETKDHPPNR